MRTYKSPLLKLPNNGIFVFGSNTEGRHGKGSALIAKKQHGAIYGQPKGLQGKSYAIITKDLTKKYHPSISIDFIINQIHKLYLFAVVNKELDFYIAYSAYGSNLNSYSPAQMAEMFSRTYIPKNIIFEENFSRLLYLKQPK